MSAHSLISPEVLVPRLGEQLVESGLLTADQLQQVLEYQRREASAGEPILLGQAILALGFLDRAALDRAVTEQILHLREALVDANRNLENRVRQRTSELQEALRKLEELNQLKANFVANISHELRTPLTHILGYMDLMQDEVLGPLNSDQNKAVEVSLHSAYRLQTLIDDLLMFTMASQGRMTLMRREINLPALARKAVEQTRPMAEDKQIDLSLMIDQRVETVNADQEKLSWVLAHLLENSIKFTLSGGKVRLSINPDAKNAQLTQVMVADTGIGIPAERIKEVFEPFSQLDSSPVRRYGGTGLGLALVRQIVEAHGSHIIVKSVPDKGTVVSFPLLTGKRDGAQ